jgi:hypothetical protein
MTITYIGTTRFNNETIHDNRRYKESRMLGCIYGTGFTINEQYQFNCWVFVVEMNNSTNLIEGIGLIRNNIEKNNYYNIYDNHGYNRYTYIGKWRASREQMVSKIPNIVRILEIILFKGKSHFKRISGISVITENLISNWNHNKIIKNTSILQQMNLQIQQAFYELFKLTIFRPINI